ncbi:GTP-ase activating protein for Arf containing protein [Aphelenchoides avenae]|nr:GTP-ase activating protein for Arf containing protein [Aphelenchus avenae]
MTHTEEEPQAFMCADCGALDPQWASINRGVMICSECCYVHRNLGRHISQVRSLAKGVWHANQLALVETLCRSGANNIWEHALLDPQQTGKTRKKPNSNDPVIPKKERFITAKYEQTAYAIRPSKDEQLTLEDLNRQLWSCVRTSHVETTLRFLALGADPTYADPEKGNTPLHVAAKENQQLQVELLWVYGADAAQRNAAGHTPAAVARLENHNELADRLDELEFEMTDHFSLFLCGRKPDHARNQHFLVPDLVGQGNEALKPFRRYLQQSSGVVLERLMQDVYDEVDRREVAAQWSATQPYLGMHQHVAVFLPPNKKLSATRNQMRQKLAKYDSREFAQLLIDLLKEAKRRYNGLPLPPDEDALNESALRALDLSTNAYNLSSDLAFSFDDQSNRDYDEVPDSMRKSRTSSSTKRSSEVNKTTDSDDRPRQGVGHEVGLDDYLELKEQLREVMEKMNVIAQSNAQLVKGFQSLQKTVDQVQDGHEQLRRELSQQQDATMRRNMSPVGTTSRPMSPVPGAVVMPANAVVQSKAPLAEPTSTTHARPPAPASRLAQRHHSLTTPTSASAYETVTVVNVPIKGPGGFVRNGSAPPESSTDDGRPPLPPSLTEPRPSSSFKALFSDDVFPDNLILETELLTGAIKNLLADLQQEGSHANAVFHSDSIRYHISRIVYSIPRTHLTGMVQVCVDEMNAAITTLARKCATRPLNADETCHAAYDVAKAAKQLLVTVHGRGDFV